MRFKGLALVTLCVILTALPGCDNVQWDGIELELRSPDPPPSALVEPEPEVEGDEEQPPEPIVLGPLLYLAEHDGTGARVLPVAEWRDGEYHPLPDVVDTPDLVERFPLERWERGTEFVLVDRGVRVGAFIADGTAVADGSTCRVRPAGPGQIELHPAAVGTERFLAVRKADVDAGLLSDSALAFASERPGTSGAALRELGASAGRFVIARSDIPWPSSIPEIVDEVRELGPSGEASLLAASFIFGDEPEVGSAVPSAYAFLSLFRDDGDGPDPFWLWYQPVRQGKAIPRVLGSGPVVGPAPEVILEVLGTDARGLAILGERDGEWSLLFRDECGPGPSSGAAGAWP